MNQRIDWFWFVLSQIGFGLVAGLVVSRQERIRTWQAAPLAVRLGVEAGLGEREARAALVLREGQDGVVAAERHAGTLGITAVPTYIFDGQYTLSGAQEPSNMARILDQVAEFAAAREAAP